MLVKSMMRMQAGGSALGRLVKWAFPVTGTSGSRREEMLHGWGVGTSQPGKKEEKMVLSGLLG